MEKIVLSAMKTKENTSWKPLMVPSELYDQIEVLAEQVGMRKGYLATKLLDFALDRVEIKEEEK